jgi:hypothetical protein
MACRLPLLFGLFVAAAAPLAARDLATGGGPVTGERQARLMQQLVAAYPDFLAGADGNEIVWRDGTRMRFDDGRTGKDFAALLDAPDLEDQFYAPYLQGDAGLAPARDIDPGRVRFEPFFRKMYGDCKADEVTGKLQPVVWLPKHDGRTIMVTGVNGVAKRLAAVSAELDDLVGKQPALRIFLIPPAGTYNCRVIAGTARASVHGFGAAIDIATTAADYWRWAKGGKGAAGDKTGKSGPIAWRNRVPLDIVDVFERHGFIWGGKWYHFDTMHFEYRPELLGISGAG